MEWLEIEAERLGLRLRFAWAFHAREVRLERERDGRREPLFPEVFSFHPERHDPVEFALQLEELWANPSRLAPEARRRDAQALVRRLLVLLPPYLERGLDRVARLARLTPPTRVRLLSDAALLVWLIARFLSERGLDREPGTERAALHLRKLFWEATAALACARLGSGRLGEEVARVRARRPEAELADPAVAQLLVRVEEPGCEGRLASLALAAFHAWLEGVCLDEANGVFEREDSPFADREQEVLRAISADGSPPVRRGRDLSPFLRRPHQLDCLRLLAKLEVFFLRRYDVHHAAVAIRHGACMARGEDDSARVLSHHSARGYALVLLAMALPFLAAAFAYQRASLFFDALCSLEVFALEAGAFWYLIYRFGWKKDLTLFRASVPRIGAGIIVGYLPVFLIDEVWDLARRPALALAVVALLLGLTTLLYIYVEVQRRIGDPEESFRRAGRLFLLGLLQAVALGLLVTSLLGPFMVVRTWAGPLESASLAEIRAITPPIVGELPRILGVQPLLAFPTAVFLMSFLSFFIGTFLQLLWEDLPITEPL